MIETVKNTIRDAKMEFRRMLPELITQKCESLQAKLKAAIKRLRGSILNVKEYCSFNE